MAVDGDASGEARNCDPAVGASLRSVSVGRVRLRGMVGGGGLVEVGCVVGEGPMACRS